MTGTRVDQLGTLLAANSKIQQSFVTAGPQGPSHAVAIVLGDMTKITADAYVVPHFQGAVSYGGVGAAVARGGAGLGLQKYEQIISALGQELKWGDVTITPSGGGQSKNLIHVVSVGSSDAEEEAGVVSTAISQVLLASQQNNLDTIVVPALGTGVVGYLTAGQSARAILGALFTYWGQEPQNAPHQIVIAIYGNPEAYRSFEAVLRAGVSTAEAASIGHGERKVFDMRRWVADITGGMEVESTLRGDKKN